MLTSEDTRQFYDKTGWQVTERGTIDKQWFGDGEHGPIQEVMFRTRMGRIHDTLRLAGNRLHLLDLCRTYTGADFSSCGLQVAEVRLRDQGVPFKLVEAPADRLPFDDGAFDALYCAHMLYHIPTLEEQARAFAEIVRVVRPGGVIVLVVANPRPILFPVRVLRRMVADIPALSRLANRLRRTPPLPLYTPPIRWMQRQLAPFGDVSMTCHQIASVWQAQHVSEKSVLGRALWSFERRLEERQSPLTPYLGNSLQLVLHKRGE